MNLPDNNSPTMKQTENKKYDIRDFNNWLESNPSEKEGVSWGINQAIIDSKVEHYYFNDENDISQTTPFLTWEENCIKVVKKWIKIQERWNNNETNEIKVEKIWNILFDEDHNYDYEKLFNELENLKNSAISLQIKKQKQQLENLRERLVDGYGKKLLSSLALVSKELDKETNELKKAKLEGKKEVLEELIKENIQNELINQIISEENKLIYLQEQISLQ